MLAGLAVASMFRHVVASVRTTITLLSSPLARRSRMSESALNQVWSEIDTSSRFTSIFRQSVDSVDFGADVPAKTHVWFRDLIGIKGQHLLGVHLLICQRLDAEEARVAKTGGPAVGDDGGESYLDMLRRVKEESDNRLLQVAREFTAMIVSLLGSVPKRRTSAHSRTFTIILDSGPTDQRSCTLRCSPSSILETTFTTWSNLPRGSKVDLRTTRGQKRSTSAEREYIPATRAERFAHGRPVEQQAYRNYANRGVVLVRVGSPHPPSSEFARPSGAPDSRAPTAARAAAGAAAAQLVPAAESARLSRGRTVPCESIREPFLVNSRPRAHGFAHGLAHDDYDACFPTPAQLRHGDCANPCASTLPLLRIECDD